MRDFGAEDGSLETLELGNEVLKKKKRKKKRKTPVEESSVEFESFFKPKAKVSVSISTFKFLQSSSSVLTS